MHKLRLIALLLASCIVSIFIAPSASGISNDVVISQVQIGNVSSSRLIELYNNSDDPVDITDWCINYRSAADNKTSFTPVCFNTAHESIHQIIRARSYILITSTQLDVEGDEIMVGGLGNTYGEYGGHVYIEDNNKLEIDRVGWGTAQKSEGLLPAIIGIDNINYVLERKQDEFGAYIDTDVNLEDFKDSELREQYLIGAIDEIIDVCMNLPEIQILMPVGKYRDTTGDCALIPVDVCLNLIDIQTILPPGYEFDEKGNCQPDVCLNISGLQLILPDEYKIDVDGDCVLDLAPLKITELLPNAIGSDDNNEFIEIYNPNSIDVNLNYYALDVGLDYQNSYDFPVDLYINAGQYLKFSNDDIKFTLVNSSSRVRLRAIDNSYIDETLIYNDPDSGASWALIDGVWQFTNQPTPSGANLPSIIEPVVIIKPKSSLVPCKDGQYRSEETNRCRNIVSDVASLVPCAEGQERNPATNRCRSVSAILSASDLKPCDVGQERNPETNRCRNITTMPTADYKPEQVNESSNNNILYWSMGIIGLVAVGYGVWEWRVELLKFFRRLLKHK